MGGGILELLHDGIARQFPELAVVAFCVHPAAGGPFGDDVRLEDVRHQRRGMGDPFHDGPEGIGQMSGRGGMDEAGMEKRPGHVGLQAQMNAMLPGFLAVEIAGTVQGHVQVGHVVAHGGAAPGGPEPIVGAHGVSHLPQQPDNSPGCDANVDRRGRDF